MSETPEADKQPTAREGDAPEADIQPIAREGDAGRPAGHEAGADEKNCFDKFVHKLDNIVEKNYDQWDVKWRQLDKMREWLMVLATLAVSIAYEAGLNPPGGFWQDDGNGHAAGNPVLQTTNRERYLTFYYFNTMSLVASLIIIALLMNKGVSVQCLVFTTMFDLLSLVVAYIAGSTSNLLPSIGVIVIAGATFTYFARGVLLIVFVSVLATLLSCIASLACVPCGLICGFCYGLTFIWGKLTSKYAPEQDPPIRKQGFEERKLINPACLFGGMTTLTLIMEGEYD